MLQSVLLTKHYYDYQIKVDEMSGAHSTRGIGKSQLERPRHGGEENNKINNWAWSSTIMLYVVVRHNGRQREVVAFRK
jgi:hypothetical protein